MVRGNKWFSKLIVYLLLIVLSTSFIFPFYFLVRSSLMSSLEIFSIPMKWLPETLRFKNYADAVKAIPFVRYFINTSIIVVSNVVGCVLSSSFVAFGFSRISFKGRNFWFAVLLSTMMIPDITLLIPQFIGWKALGAYNTYWPLILPAFYGKALFVFLVRQYYKTLPKSIDEAALIDGASYFTIYVRIILPLSKPVLASVGVFAFMYNWNDFFGPLIYLSSSEKYTLALGLQSFIGQYTAQWNLLMAVSCIVIVPMVALFFFAQRFFIEGIAFTGLKE